MQRPRTTAELVLSPARPLFLVLLVSCTACDDEASRKPSTQDEAPSPWGKLQDHVTASAPAEQIVEQLRRRAQKSKPFSPYPGNKDKARKRANDLLTKLAEPGQRFDLLEPPMAWGAQPKKNRNAHSRRNAFRPLRPLITAHMGSGDPRYLSHLKRVMLDWVEYNLVEKHKNSMMWHGMAAGLRGTILAYLVDQELREASVDQRELSKLIWAARQHCEVLANPRLFTEGNHGLYMMQGLKALVHVLPELRAADEFGRYADEKMGHLLSAHFSKDGFHLEHSPEYHMLTTRSLENIMNMGLFENVKGLERTIEQARSVTYQLFHPNDDRVMIGDTSRARPSVRGVAREHHRFVQTEGKQGRRPKAGLQVHPDVGYGFYRSSFDEKPFSDHSFLFFAPGYHSQHHKQADHLTFEWSEQGLPILVDSGKFDHARSEWREFFLSTRAGNAVEVDEKDYSTRSERPWGGGFSTWGELGQIQYMQAHVEHEKLEVWQTRTLLLAPRKWLCVIDQMSAEKPHTYRQWFQFHETLTVSEQGKGFVAEGPDGFKVFVASSALNGQLTIEYALGQTEPRIVGWLSANYRKKQKRSSIALKTQGQTVVLASVFAVSGSARPPALKQLESELLVSVPSGTQGRRVEIRPKQVALE